MAIEIIGGSELATPTQAKVMMFGFPPSSWQLTKTTGVTKTALVGFTLFLGIFPSRLSFLIYCGRHHTLFLPQGQYSLAESSVRLQLAHELRLQAKVDSRIEIDHDPIREKDWHHF